MGQIREGLQESYLPWVNLERPERILTHTSLVLLMGVLSDFLLWEDRTSCTGKLTLPEGLTWSWNIFTVILETYL